MQSNDPLQVYTLYTLPSLLSLHTEWKEVSKNAGVMAGVTTNCPPSKKASPKKASQERPPPKRPQYKKPAYK